MTNQIQSIKNIASKAALGVLASAQLMGTSARAENAAFLDQLVNQFEAGRVRTEYVNQEDKVETFKTTVGSAPKGNYDGLPISVKGQLYESAKINLMDDFLSGERYAAPGLNLNFKFGEVSTRTIAFGSFGDRESFGLEQQAKYGIVTPSFSFEHNFMKDANRIGGQLTLDPTKKLSLVGGYDLQTVKGKETSQFFGKSLVTVSANDTIGAAYAFKEYPNKTEDIAAGFWTHSGKGSSYGSRLYGDIKSDSLGNQSASGHYILILNKNAVIGPGGATLLLDRQASANQNVFSMSVADSPFDLEGIPIGERNPDGWSFRVSGKYQHTRKADYSTLAGTVAYTLPLGKNASLTSQFEYSHLENSLTGGENCYNPAFKLEYKNFLFGPSVTFSDRSPTKFLLEVTYKF